MLNQFALSFFVPIYFVSMGLTADFIRDFDVRWTASILFVACASKITSAFVAARLAGLNNRTSLVVGMAMNPFPKAACKALDEIGQAYHLLSYGSYFSDWRRRLALKMWTGWPTFPMVFVKGTLVGGANELQKLLESGELGGELGGKRAG